MPNAKKDIEIYKEAADLCRLDPLRQGSLIELPNFGQVVLTGDLHGHRRNLERIQNFADLESAPARHVLLHEIVHAEPEDFECPDMSHSTLLSVAKWKCDFPDQVHLIMGNHELAQLTGHGISKGGRIVTYDFIRGVTESYGIAGEEVYEAMCAFIRSFALAARTPHRVFFSHSLPGKAAANRFDPDVLSIPPEDLDFSDASSAYDLLWGRFHTPEVLDQLSEKLDADLFVCGHQPQEDGYEIIDNRLIILASDHNHGVILPLDLRKKPTMESLEESLRPLASIR